MIRTFLAALCLLCVLSVRAAQADVILVYTITVDQPEYTIGETVNWTLAVMSSADAQNTGILGLSVGLDESTAETLVGGTIDGDFAGYDIKNPGAAAGASITDISVVEPFLPSPDLVTGGTLATGTYDVTVLGVHSLTASIAFPADSSYVNQSLVPTLYDQIIGDTTEFTVVPEIIPEPSTFILTAIGLFGLGVFGRRCTRVHTV